MTDNKLLECWLDLVDNRPNAAKYYLKRADNTANQDQTIDTIVVDRIKTLARHSAITPDFRYLDFVELFVNSYVNELLAKLNLQRGESKTEPHPFWVENYSFVRHLEPQALIRGDFDHNKDYLQLDVFTSLTISDRIVPISQSFMREAHVPEIQTSSSLRTF